MDAHAMLADDYRWWENTAPVSVTFKKGGGATTLTVSTAARGIGSAARLMRQLFGPLSAQVEHEMFVLPDTLLQGESIKPGDVITDDGATNWTVDRVAPLKARTQWACMCTRQR